MEINYLSYYKTDPQIESEKLFKILEKLQSILDNAKTLPNSEQFILGVESSMDVVRGVISGNFENNKGSIKHPNQIPLI